MSAILDHIFICTLIGAPAALRLRQLGLTEGSPNQHPGQGTACRRFFFQNAMLELLWVENATEAQSKQTRATQLYERWTAAGREASPFGIILRPESRSHDACPFPAWDYRPKTMPDLVLQIATGTGSGEPMWCYMEGGRAPSDAPPDRRQPMEHPVGFHRITGVRLGCPPLNEASVTHTMATRKVIALDIGTEHLLALEFDGNQHGRHADLRPDLPLICRW